MMNYATYEEYAKYSTAAKKVTRTDFKRLVREASQKMDYLTRNRTRNAVSCADGIPDEVTENIICCCANLVDFLSASSKFVVEDRGVVTQESVDKWRVAYKIPSHLSPDNPDRSMYLICQKWLTRPINLMYVGG